MTQTDVGPPLLSAVALAKADADGPGSATSKLAPYMRLDVPYRTPNNQACHASGVVPSVSESPFDFVIENSILDIPACVPSL